MILHCSYGTVCTLAECMFVNYVNYANYAKYTIFVNYARSFVHPSVHREKYDYVRRT